MLDRLGTQIRKPIDCCTSCQSPGKKCGLTRCAIHPFRADALSVRSAAARVVARFESPVSGLHRSSARGGPRPDWPAAEIAERRPFNRSSTTRSSLGLWRRLRSTQSIEGAGIRRFARARVERGPFLLEWNRRLWRCSAYNRWAAVLCHGRASSWPAAIRRAQALAIGSYRCGASSDSYGSQLLIGNRNRRPPDGPRTSKCIPRNRSDRSANIAIQIAPACHVRFMNVVLVHDHCIADVDVCDIATGRMERRHVDFARA
jgi:hypothetical protein